MEKIYTHMDATTLKDYDSIQSFKNMVDHCHEDGYDLLVYHPGYLDDFILKNSSLTIPRTLEVKASCSQEIKNYIKNKAIKLYTYDDI